MTPKLLAITDDMTRIPSLALQLTPANEAERHLLALAGYGTTAEVQSQYVILYRLSDGGKRGTTDPWDWQDRTMRTAHAWLIEHFDEVASGDEVDVRGILRERTRRDAALSALSGGA